MSAAPIGVNTYAYAWTTPAADVVKRLAGLGYRSFELLIHPPHLPLDGFDAASRRKLAAALNEAGATNRSLNLPSLDHNLASPMPRARAASVQMFRDTIDLANDLAVQWLVLVPGRMSALAPASHEQRSAWLRAGVDALLPYAEAKGVRLAVENVPMAAFPDAASLGAFVRGYGSANLGVCYDAANAHFIGESPDGGIAELADILRIVHLSDTTREAWRHDPIGQGDVPFVDLPPALASAGFAGPCFLELLDPHPDAAIIRGHAMLAALGFAPRGSEAAA
jgi:L-ribulose-5-phosphate 3-epimerase